MHHAISITGAAVLLALAPSVLAVGTATLVNSCGFNIYYAAIDGTSEGMTMLPPGGSYSEGYANPGVGTSIKVAPTDSLNDGITQFEFTWEDGKINYDISNINGNPFASAGMVLTPSMSGDPKNPTCVPVDCPAGEATCTAAYNQPDDTDTMVCNDQSNLVFTVCSGGSKTKRELENFTHPDTAVRHSHHRVHARHLPKK